MTAPITRIVEQSSGDVVPGAALAETLEAGLPVANAQLAQAAEIARLREELDGRKTELDNVMYQFRHLGETTAGLTGLMNDYHTERERDWLTARVQELTAAERDAEAHDTAVNDAAEASEGDQ